MANGLLIETMIQAKNIDALNRSAVCAADIDGGNVVTLAPATDGSDVWTAAVPTTQTLGDLWIAYNPSENLSAVEGKNFTGLSKDPRDFTNVETRVFDVFKPKKGDIITLTADAVTDDTSAAVGGYFIGQNAKAQLKYTTSAPTEVTGFQIIEIGTMPFPKTSGIGMDFVVTYKCECIIE